MVTGWDSWSEGCRFEFQHSLLERHFHINLLQRNYFFVCKRPKINGKEAGMVHLKKRWRLRKDRRTWLLKAHSHYCVFRMRLQQTVALLCRDRKIPISALTQSTAESADRCGECEWALNVLAKHFQWTDNLTTFCFCFEQNKSFMTGLYLTSCNGNCIMETASWNML